ncbi:hypothetical protein PMLGA01_140015200, partial [Plasmodium malariae]
MSTERSEILVEDKSSLFKKRRKKCKITRKRKKIKLYYKRKSQEKKKKNYKIFKNNTKITKRRKLKKSYKNINFVMQNDNLMKLIQIDASEESIRYYEQAGYEDSIVACHVEKIKMELCSRKENAYSGYTSPNENKNGTTRINGSGGSSSNNGISGRGNHSRSSSRCSSDICIGRTDGFTCVHDDRGNEKGNVVNISKEIVRTAENCKSNSSSPGSTSYPSNHFNLSTQKKTEFFKAKKNNCATCIATTISTKKHFLQTDRLRENDKRSRNGQKKRLHGESDSTVLKCEEEYASNVNRVKSIIDEMPIQEYKIVEKENTTTYKSSSDRATSCDDMNYVHVILQYEQEGKRKNLIFEKSQNKVCAIREEV